MRLGIGPQATKGVPKVGVPAARDSPRACVTAWTTPPDDAPASLILGRPSLPVSELCVRCLHLPHLRLHSFAWRGRTAVEMGNPL